MFTGMAAAINWQVLGIEALAEWNLQCRSQSGHLSSGQQSNNVNPYT